MMKIYSLSLLIFTVILISSCSGRSNPVVQDLNQREDFYLNISEALSNINNTGSPVNPYRNIFGAWEIRIDKENLTTEIIPARNARAIGDMFDADLQQFLTVSPCANCLMITGMEIEIINPVYFGMFELVNIDFTMKHPFDDITTRPDLHGFDVRLIFVAPMDVSNYPDIEVTLPDGSTEEAAVHDSYLLNADGYTSHYDELAMDERYFINTAEIPGNLNPYLRFFNDYSDGDFDPQSPSGHNVISVGSSTNTRTATLDLNEFTDVVALYAVADVAYGQSAVFMTRTDPKYFLPAFHRTEAWRTEYWIENNELDATDPTTTAEIVVQVFDWQHAASVDPDYPDPGNLSAIPASSDVVGLGLSIPGLQLDTVYASDPESGTGSPVDPLQYRLTISNQMMSSMNQTGLLAVRDELHGQASPEGRIPIPESPSGFPYETQDILDYTHYDLIHINIPHPLMGGEYNQEVTFFPWDTFANEGRTSIYAIFFMDPGGKKFQYDWDWEYHGGPSETFDVEDTGNPSPEHTFNEGQLASVGLRVTTNTVPPREYFYAIPVYSEGVWWDNTGDNGAIDTTYYSRNHALAMTDTHYYLAYTSEIGGEREIMLGIGEIASGTLSQVNLTNNFNSHAYNPSIIAIKDGVNDGIHVAYSVWNGPDSDLYYDRGNLDGTGFDGSHRIPLSDDILSEDNVCLYATDIRLYAYYMHDDAVTLEDICVSSKTFLSNSWTFEGTVNSPSDGDQNYPSVAKVGDYLYCVWQDGRDLFTRGNDIYIAASNDLVNFTESVLVSNSIGSEDEVYPSICGYRTQLGVAYLQKDPGGLQVIVSIIDSLYGYSLNYPIQYGAGSRDHTTPAISTDANGRFTVAYGLYDTASNDLEAAVVELSSAGDRWSVMENVLYSTDAGTIHITGANIFPGVVTRRLAFGTVIENFIAFRSFINGSTDSTTPFNMKFGDIQIVGIFSEGDLTEY